MKAITLNAMQHSRPARQQGMVLVTALVFLVILTLLGISSMGTNTLEERMAGGYQDVNRSFQAAESGLNSAFRSGTAFAGTTEGYTDTATDTDLGTYSADSTFTSTFRTSTDITGYQAGATASSEGMFRWYYFDVTSTGATESGTGSTLGAGAKVLGQ